MNLVLLRHATRSPVPETGQGSGANEYPLNSVGLTQAEDLVGAVEQLGKLPPPTLIFSSPKLRARQTMTPLSKAFEVEIKIFDDLDERLDSESLSSFEKRVRGAYDILKSHAANETVYFCTHLDVLETASALWPTDFSEREMAQSWSTLEYQVFNYDNGLLKSGLRARIPPRG